MPVVTALRATRRRDVALHVDGEYVCVVSDALVAQWRLFKGRELDEAQVAAIRVAATRERVMADAYRLLGHRARSAHELRQRLLAKEHQEATIDDALERLSADGLLDDAAFARSYVADKRRLASWGAERIRRGLRALGVEPAIIDQAVGAEPADDEVARALIVLRKRGAPREPLDAARRRAFQALQRRGFSSAVAYAALRLWVNEERADPN